MSLSTDPHALVGPDMSLVGESKIAEELREVNFLLRKVSLTASYFGNQTSYRYAFCAALFQ